MNAPTLHLSFAERIGQTLQWSIKLRLNEKVIFYCKSLTLLQIGQVPREPHCHEEVQVVSHSSASGLLNLPEFSLLWGCKLIFIINVALQCARCTTLVKSAMLNCVLKCLKSVSRRVKNCM